MTLREIADSLVNMSLISGSFRDELLMLAAEIEKHVPICVDCRKEIDKGCGLEKSGVLTPLCYSCLNKRFLSHESIRDKRVD